MASTPIPSTPMKEAFSPAVSTPASALSLDPESSAMSPSSSASKSGQPQETNPFITVVRRVTCPIAGAPYGHRLQCLLMNYLQAPLETDPHCPQGFFIPDSVIEACIHHKTVPMEVPIDPHGITYQYGLSSLPNLKHIQIEIYIFKEPSTAMLGRKHYRVDAHAICFDQHDWMIIGPQEDVCRGFISFEWFNDNVAYTMDWDMMDFGELLRLLRRAAKRNFDGFGAKRSDEDKAKMDKELGDIFPMRGKDNSPVEEEMLHKFPMGKE